MFISRKFVGFFLVGLSVLLASQSVSAAPKMCGAKKIKEVLQPATTKKKSVRVNCHLSLKESDVVTKQLLLKGPAASGVRVNCNNATLDGRGVNKGADMIRVYSSKVDDKWQRPENIQIRGCKIYGSARIYGMAKNGEGKHLRASSKSLGHIQRAQQAAPKNIIFDRMQFIGQGRIPLYFSPGVSFSRVTNSVFSGTSVSTVIYLDAESYGNVIQGNKITTKTKKRELIAIDGSAGNKIMNNYLMNADRGGIYLYRNCGEKGTVRHQTPHKNQITNNAFQYRAGWYVNPSIWLGSRQGRRFHCREDRGYRFGSSVSNRDFAQNNIIQNNQFVGMEPNAVIQVSDQPNNIANNRRVYQQTVYRPPTVANVARANNAAQSKKAKAPKKIIWKSATPKPFEELPFGCAVTGSNSGCNGTVSCPSGKRIKSVKVACNLEGGKVSLRHVNAVPWNTTWILKPSDRVWDGVCQIANTEARSGQVKLSSLQGRSGFNYHCRERDRNGGDCDMKGLVKCQ